MQTDGGQETKPAQTSMSGESVHDGVTDLALFLFFCLISTSLGLGQTTCTTPGISVGHATAPMAI